VYNFLPTNLLNTWPIRLLSRRPPVSSRPGLFFGSTPPHTFFLTPQKLVFKENFCLPTPVAEFCSQTLVSYSTFLRFNLNWSLWGFFLPHSRRKFRFDTFALLSQRLLTLVFGFFPLPDFAGNAFFFLPSCLGFFFVARISGFVQSY